MKPISYVNTYGVIKKLNKDLDLITKVVDFLVQVIFLFFYGYSIYANLDKPILLVVYIVLFIISILYFFFYVLTLRIVSKNFKKKVKCRVKKSVKCVKYLTRFVTVGVALFEFFNYEISDFNKILTIVSCISLGVQILIDIVTKFVMSYVNLFTQAVQMDYEDSAVIKGLVKTGNFFSNPKASVLSALDIIPEKINDKKNDDKGDESKELTPEQIKTREKINKYKEEIIEEKAQNKKNQTIKEKEELKSHLKSIFKRKT
ncbi:MAG: hypothetical protein E7176_05560 [Erysipelotrichaceae bacterium]|nr:hypothetical protein [Erysipelotrichaceae bacterium]